MAEGSTTVSDEAPPSPVYKRRRLETSTEEEIDLPDIS